MAKPKNIITPAPELPKRGTFLWMPGLLGYSSSKNSRDDDNEDGDGDEDGDEGGGDSGTGISPTAGVDVGMAADFGGGGDAGGMGESRAERMISLTLKEIVSPK